LEDSLGAGAILNGVWWRDAHRHRDRRSGGPVVGDAVLTAVTGCCAHGPGPFDGKRWEETRLGKFKINPKIDPKTFQPRGSK
jgi:hypothetical protein